MAKKNLFEDVVKKMQRSKELTRVEIQPRALNDLWDGVHLGAVYSIWGEEGSGKSTVLFQVIRSLMKQGYKGVFLDVEKALNENQLNSFNLTQYVEDGSLIILPLDNMLQYEEVVDSLVDSDIKFIVVDSQTMVGAYVDKDLKITDVRPGIKALQESTVLKKLKDICYEKEIAAFLLCHARANIQIQGVFNRYAPTTKQAGGWALLHTPDIITQISKGSKVKDDDGKIVGIDITMQTTKNKYVPPFTPVKETIYFGKGIDAKLSMIKQALELGVIIHTKGSRYYTLPFEPDVKYTSTTIWELTADQCRQLKAAVESLGDVQ